MDKYFTPDIEDIRVGYELESHEWSMDEMGIPELNYDRWTKKILDYPFVQTLVQYGTKGTRVPYLTKEQIEAEGWKFERDHIVELEFSKKEYELTLTKDSYLRIAWFGEGDITRFSGTCKDINTFRYICKLLKVD